MDEIKSEQIRAGILKSNVFSRSYGGAIKPARELKALARTFTVEAVETIYNVMTSKKCAAGTRLYAAGMLLDRGWGRPAPSDKMETDKTDSASEIRAAIQAIMRGESPEDIAEAVLEESVLNDGSGDLTGYGGYQPSGQGGEGGLDGIGSEPYNDSVSLGDDDVIDIRSDTGNQTD